MKLFKVIFREPQTNFEREFGHEVLVSERKRIKILAGVFTFALISVLLANLLFGNLLEIGEKGRYWVLVLLVGAIVYEIAAWFGFGHLIKTHRHLPLLPRYGNALIETSLPTFLLVVLIPYVGPLQALISPLSYAYFIFILLASMRLDFKLCLFTGAVATLGHLGLVLYYLDDLPPFSGDTLFASSPLLICKSFLFLLSGLLAGFIAGEIRETFSKWIRSMEERNEIIHVFGQHVSPAVVNRLLAQKAGMESEVRFVCLMFLDIRNFTTFSETRSPAEVVNYLNTLFEFMIDDINRHNGIINKFLGDGFMAVFGAPLSDGQECRNAVAAAIEIIAKVEELSASGRIPPTRIGIGLHAGEAVTGNVGSPQRKEYTIIGDAVNLASRIEQLNKQFNSQLLVSESVWDNLAERTIEAVALDPIQVKGRQAPVQIFKLA